MNFSRRTVLGGALAGFGGMAASSLLAARGDSKGGGGTTSEVTFGSNYSDSVPKAAMDAVLQAYPHGKSVKVNTVDLTLGAAKG